MGVDRAPADRGTRSPHFPQELHARRDRTAPPHQCQQEPEFRTRHSHRLSSPQYGLSRWLEQHAAETDRSSQAGRCTRRKTTSSSQQLLHSRDELAYNRRIRVTSTIWLMRPNEVSFGALYRNRSGNLKLMDDGAGL
jgi:hypothetical protein